jgi:protein TonB
MMVQFRGKIVVNELVRPEAIKVRLVQEALKEMALNQKRQIVQSEDSVSDEKKDEAYLSDKTRSFDRETIAKNIDSFKKAALGNASISQIAQKPQAQKKKAPKMKDLKLSDFGLMSGDPMPKEVSRSPASTSKRGMENGDPDSEGLSATNDYVQEVQLGDFTHLNTVEYKYYGFFHRIRQKLEQFWGNSIQEKSMALFRSGRKIASHDYVTSLQVTLNEKGEIIGVKILGASGVKELDDAAVESFNQAGPFPNPPQDLLVNGKAVIEWGFVVKS